MWIALFAAAAVLAAAFVLVPLLGPREALDGAASTDRLEHILAERTLTLRALKDLEHEHDGGFLDDGDYARVRQEYLHRAVELNRELQDVTGVDPLTATGMDEEGRA